MPTLIPASTVLGAPRIPVPYGLFSVLAPRPSDQVTRWEGGGVTWEYLPGDVHLGAVGPVQGVAGNGDQPSAQASGLPKDLSASDMPYANAEPFTVYGHWTGSILSRNFAEARSGAIEHLQVFEERQVEEALWAGIAKPNLSTNTTAVGGGSIAAEDLIIAVADLEDFLSDTYGSQGVLHMSRRTALLAMKYGAIEPERNRLVTKLGTPVIAGTGYENGKVVATPPLFGYRSEIITSSNRLGDLADLKHNDMTAIAERTYLIGFDPTGVGVATITE